MSDAQRRNIALWLLMICLIIFFMISLGGITRLTGSGLSMVEWAPVTGILPPLNDAQWLAVFKLYQASPEYLDVNQTMTLEGFKTIFWFEYFHRLLGRLIGILFLLPMLYFFIRYPLPASLRFKLIALFLLGGAQGLLGWYMVKSGLVNDPHVSQYRLVAHLALALFLYVAIFWLASAYFIRDWAQRYPTPALLRWSGISLFAVIFVTLLAGGFVAGTRAGFAFNTFPLMNGQLIPRGYAALDPFWLNLFENVATVQFNHRLLATLGLCLATVCAWVAYQSALMVQLKRLFFLALFVICLQYLLGVLTLIHVVPVSLAAAHQAMAVIALTLSVLLARTLFHLHGHTRA